QRVAVAQQIPAVGLERAGGEPALDRQVVEVPADRAGDRDQLSTSLGLTEGRPRDSPAGGQVRIPSCVFRPGASAGSARSASRQPRPAISRMYGRVTLVSA